MAPAKRGRPAFSPPKPRKASSTSKSKSTASGGVSKKSGSTSRGTSGSLAKSAKARSKPTAAAARKRSRLVSPTPSATDSLGDSNDEHESMSVDDEEDEEDEELDRSHVTNQQTEESPEPDFILAEISHDAGSTGPAIPLGLIHRILHSQFAEPEKTKISTDAREVVGKYIETFVREAIARCAFEKTDEGQEMNHTEQNDGGGWLEVDDLEKVAVQLCLDF